MGDWQQFLEDSGAQFDGENAISFGESSADYSGLTNTLCDLGDLGMLSAQGPDSQKFLQGQSTCEILALAPGRSTPGAICNPKGRMITSFQAYVEAEDHVLLSMDKDLVEPTLAALGKYAAFFNTVLTNNSDTYSQFGLTGPTIQTELLKLFPSIPSTNNFVTDIDGNILGCLAEHLFVVITKTEHAQELWKQLTLNIPAVGLPWWRLQLIRAGQASITAALTEQFVPQMLNLQATNAISFDKGCYTGQEVVARMEYLGKLKRRTYLVKASSKEIPVPGTEVATKEGKSVGIVVQAAPADLNNFEMLAVLREAAMDQNELLIMGEAVPVKFCDLPYEISEQ
jgi:tRNA-modifying protein YgfZ